MEVEEYEQAEEVEEEKEMIMKEQQNGEVEGRKKHEEGVVDIERRRGNGGECEEVGE